MQQNNQPLETPQELIDLIRAELLPVISFRYGQLMGTLSRDLSPSPELTAWMANSWSVVYHAFEPLSQVLIEAQRILNGKFPEPEPEAEGEKP